MIKRANKLAAGLLAIAAVLSLVPSTGANAADYKRINSKDGTIYSATAYKDGKFIIDGNVKSENDEAIYYLNNGKYTELDDIDSGSEFTRVYGEKYLDVENGDYFIDLTNGKVTDDNLQEDNTDDASSSLRKNIKKNADDRYSDYATLKTNLTELEGSKYGQTWYKTTYTSKKATNGLLSGSSLNVYTDVNGNYIDADYNLGKIKVTANGKTINIENTNDQYDVADIKKSLSASVSNITEIGQDSNYIYRKATIKITPKAGTNASATVDSLKTSAQVTNYNTESTLTKLLYDKINLTTTIDGILAVSNDAQTAITAMQAAVNEKTTLADFKTAAQIGEYTIDDSATKFVYDKVNAIIPTGVEETDVATAKAIIDAALTEIAAIKTSVDNAKVNGISTTAVTIQEINGIDIDKNADTIATFPIATDGSVNFSVIQKISKSQASSTVDGAKYAKNVTSYVISDENGKIENLLGGSFAVASEKLVEYSYTSNNVNAQSIILKSKNGYYYTDIANSSDQDVKGSEAYDVDANGNLWALNGGYVYKFDNNKNWDKIYKVDGSMDELSVYDKDNMVLWNEDDEIYSIIGNKESTDNTDTDTGSDIKAGWVQASNGVWSYVKVDGTKATGWLNLNGTWYYLNANGNMATGWVNTNGTWYFLNGSGAMATGWIYNNGTWYFLNTSGAMKTGWLNDNGTWYYLNASGAMLANTSVDGYRLASNGAWIK